MTARSLALVALALATAVSSSSATADQTLDRVVAVVNTEVILSSELQRRVLGETEKTLDRRMVLGGLIDEMLLAQRAVEIYVTAGDDDVDAAIAQIKTTNSLSDQELETHLRDQGYTLEEYRRDVARQILVFRVIAAEVMTEVQSSDPDIIQRARDRYVNELRAKAYIEIRLEVAR